MWKKIKKPFKIFIAILAVIFWIALPLTIGLLLSIHFQNWQYMLCLLFEDITAPIAFSYIIYLIDDIIL